MHLDLISTIAFLVAFAAQASRLLVASRSFWSRLPAWTQTLLPVLVPTLATLAQGLTGVHTWGDLSVQFVICAGLLLPGLPSNRSSAPLQVGHIPTLTPSTGDVAVAETIIEKASMRPPPDDDSDSKTPPWAGPSAGAPVIGFLLVAMLAFHSTGCAWFNSKLPAAEKCLPTTAALAGQVATILAEGGDYVAKLEALAQMDGEATVLCAIQAFLSAKKPGASEDSAASHERAHHYLMLKGAQ